MKRCGLLRKQFGICFEAVTVHLLQDSVFSQQKLKICPQIFSSVSAIKYPNKATSERERFVPENAVHHGGEDVAGKDWCQEQGLSDHTASILRTQGNSRK